ncbi:hypothetical protein AXG93_3818s1250 [Marchantia polymorpha subsp. ruderalis]|uniref:Uncharacterized protein n=1 Tax=Marchantia polymorpha subsp. ruderalis TaxID=1480154 RepID=A0A176VHT5_MARPO|nr:hypothetical protein AXG93_3818s1250 [Marchantia polymorpha subsp. ruderalis]
MSEGIASATAEDAREKVYLWTNEAGPSGVQAQEPLEKDVESSGKKTTTSSQGLRPSERKQSSSEKNESSEKADVPESKTSEEYVKELTLSEKILEHVVEQIGGKVVESLEIPSLQDSVVPILMYLDVKREKYTMSKEAGFYVETFKNRTHVKRAAAVKTAKEMTTECAAATASLKIERIDLRGSIVARTDAYNEELQHTNELMANLVEEMKKHEAELANWATKLTECEMAKSSEVKCRLELDANCNWLRNQLKIVTE